MATEAAEQRNLGQEIGRLARSVVLWGSVTQVMLLVLVIGVAWILVAGQHDSRSIQAQILKQSDRIAACVVTPTKCPGYQPVTVTTTVTQTVPGPPQPVTVTVTQPGQVIRGPGIVRVVPSPVVVTMAPSPTPSHGGGPPGAPSPIPTPTCLLGLPCIGIPGLNMPKAGCHGNGAKAC